MAATLDLNEADAVLKEVYKPFDVKNLVYKNNPFLAMVPKDTNFVGDALPVPVRTGIPQGRSANIATAIANKYASKYEKFVLTRAKDYAAGSIDRETLKASATNMGAFIDAATSEIDGVLKTLSNSLAQKLFRNGGGAIGQVGSVTTTSLTLKSTTDVRGFERGLTLEASAADGTSGAVRSGTAQITAIDRGTGILTSGSNWTTQISGLTADDYLFAEDDFGACITGLDGYLPTGTPAALFGVTRTVDRTRLAGHDLTGYSTAPLEEALIGGCADVGVEGGMPDKVVMNNKDYANLVTSMGTRIVYDTSGAFDDEVDISFQGVKLPTDYGSVSVMSDRSCPRGVAYLLQMDTWCLHSLGECPEIIDDDSLRILRSATTDAFDVRATYYAQLACEAPGWNGRLTLQT